MSIKRFLTVLSVGVASVVLAGFMAVSAALADHDHPQHAQRIAASLVPSFTPCNPPAVPNATHNPPLPETNACEPPTMTATRGRIVQPGQAMAFPDKANPSDSVSNVYVTVQEGDDDATNNTPADQADVLLAGAITDAWDVVGGGDYNPLSGSTPDLTAFASIRVADHNSTANAPNTCDNTLAGAAECPAVVRDFNFTVPVFCTSNADPNVGATCQVNTTADTLIPGVVKEGARANIQIARIQIRDVGVNNTFELGGGDDSLFLTQGIYIP